MSNKENRPKVGLGVYVINNGKLLLLKRQGAHGEGSWCPPGGHLEGGESFADCAIREAKEETDIDIDNVEVIGLTNDIFSEEKHYITIAVSGRFKSGKAKILELDKSSEIGWFSITNLPSPLFLTTQHLMSSDFNCFCGSGKKFKKCCGR